MLLLLSDALPRVKGYPKKVCLAGDKLFSEPPLDSGHPGWLSGCAGGPRWFAEEIAPGPRLAMIPAQRGILSVRKTGTRGRAFPPPPATPTSRRERQDGLCPRTVRGRESVYEDSPFKTGLPADESRSHIRVQSQFLHAFEAVPFPHGHLTVNQNVIGVMDNSVHDGLGNRTAVRRLGADASVPLACVVLRTENHRPVMAASLDQLQQVVPPASKSG